MTKVVTNSNLFSILVIIVGSLDDVSNFPSVNDILVLLQSYFYQYNRVVFANLTISTFFKSFPFLVAKFFTTKAKLQNISVFSSKVAQFKIVCRMVSSE